MASEDNRNKRVLLAGFPPQHAAALSRALGGGVILHSILKADTLSRDMILRADVVMIDLYDGEMLAHRIAAVLRDALQPAIALTFGPMLPSDELTRELNITRHMSEPLDYSYLRGVIDGTHHDRERYAELTREQSRIRHLYEVSSSLLKITHRDQIARSLRNALPQSLDAALILLSMPPRRNPVVFFQSEVRLGPRAMQALFEHLNDAWRALRADQPVQWDWLASIAAAADDTDASASIKSTSFLTTPISEGVQIEGFLTVLPARGRATDESFLQTFFVIGDMMSVMLHNLDLKEELEQRATHDGLTSLLNRQTLMEALERECRRSQRYASPVGIAVIDLDHFKQVNDVHGHQAGDEVLREVSRRLKATVRETDFAGRAGGEEFVAVLPNTDLEGAAQWAEKFRAAVQAEPVTFEDKKIPVTASIGVAIGQGESAEADRIVAAADEALYASKHAGRNRVTKAPLPENRAPRRSAASSVEIKKPTSLG